MGLILIFFVFSITTSETINDFDLNLLGDEIMEFRDVDINKIIEDDQSILDNCMEDFFPENKAVNTEVIDIEDLVLDNFNDFSENSTNHNTCFDFEWAESLFESCQSSNSNLNTDLSLIYGKDIQSILNKQNTIDHCTNSFDRKSPLNTQADNLLSKYNLTEDVIIENSKECKIMINVTPSLTEGNYEIEIIDNSKCYQDQMINFNLDNELVFPKEFYNINFDFIPEFNLDFPGVFKYNNYCYHYKILLFNIAENTLNIDIKNKSIFICNKYNITHQINCIIDNINRSDCLLSFLQGKDKIMSSDLFNKLQKIYDKDILIKNNDPNTIWNKILKRGGNYIKIINIEDTPILKYFVYEKLVSLPCNIDSFLVKQAFIFVVSSDLVQDRLCFLLTLIQIYFKNTFLITKSQYNGFLLNLFRCLLPRICTAKFNSLNSENKLYNERLKLQSGNGDKIDVDFLLSTFPRMLFTLNYLNFFNYDKNPSSVLISAFREIDISCLQVMSSILLKNGLIK